MRIFNTQCVLVALSLTLSWACTPKDESSNQGNGESCGGTSRACDPDNPNQIITVDGCGELVSVYRECREDSICSTTSASDPDRETAPTCIEPCRGFETLCDPDNETQIIKVDGCGELVEVTEECEENEVCTTTDPNNPDREISPRCVGTCGRRDAALVCDDSNPLAIFDVDECGNITKETPCGADKTCALSTEDGQAFCKCNPTGRNYCYFPDTATGIYNDSFIMTQYSCTGPEYRLESDEIEKCVSGTICFDDDPNINNGDPLCRRSIHESQSDSPYYDYGCDNIDTLRVQTKLAIDCRCRDVGDGGTGDDSTGDNIVNPITGEHKSRSIVNCRGAGSARRYTWPVEYGSGPHLYNYIDAGNILFFPGAFDPDTRELFGLGSFTDPQYNKTGVLFSIQVDSGARRIISGIYPTESGYEEYGSGYVSRNTDNENRVQEVPLAGPSIVRLGPDRQLYVHLVGTTGEGGNKNSSIVRVDRTTGERTLVWRSQNDDNGLQPDYGQCLDHVNNTEFPYSVNITARSFAIADDGTFYMSFHSTYEGDGVIEVSADGSTCRFVSRYGARDFNPNPDMDVPAPEDIGGGYESQFGRITVGMVRNGHVYGVDDWRTLVKFNIETGDRLAVSPEPPAGYTGIGRGTMFYDETRDYIWTSGGSARYLSSVINEETGSRQGIYGDRGSDAVEQLLRSDYPDPRAIDSASLSNVLTNGGNALLEGPIWLDPDDNNIVWLVINGGALIKFELSSFNAYIHSF